MVKPACLTPSEGSGITIKAGESTLEDDSFPVPCWRSLLRLWLIAEMLRRPYHVLTDSPLLQQQQWGRKECTEER